MVFDVLGWIGMVLVLIACVFLFSSPSNLCIKAIQSAIFAL